MDRNIHFAKVGWGVAALAGTVLFAGGLAWLFYPGGQAAPQGRQVESQPPDLRAFLEEKRARLEGYGWVDREAGRIHVPIEQAMRQMAGEGR